MSMESLLLEVFNSGGTFSRAWELGLYLSGEDPSTDLENAEVVGGGYARQPCAQWKATTAVSPAGAVIPTATFFMFSSLPATTVGGAFLARANDVGSVMHWAFETPVVVSSSTYLQVLGSDLVLNLNFSAV